MADHYDETNLLYYFWLPAGKDEFGFANAADAPLYRSMDYRNAHDIDRTIAANYESQVARLTGNSSSLAGLTTVGNLAPQDAELGLRKIQYSFHYEADRNQLPSWIAPGPLSGTAAVMSNGLYLWSFLIKYEANKTDEEDLLSHLMDFLKYDFVQRHVRRLFGFGWPDSRDRHAQRSYDGILTFFQLNLLMNGVFDAASHPHGSLSRATSKPNTHMYDVESIIKSLSLCSLGTTHRPLWDQRKEYSLRDAQNYRVDNYIDSQAALSEISPNDQEEARRQTRERERLLSRLSFAAMEQFLLISVSFGIAHYRVGLDHCRSRLINDMLLIRRNRDSVNLRRPSFKDNISRTAIEAYHAQLEGKLPVLMYVRDLVEGLVEVSAPFDAPRNGDRARGSLVEWAYGRATLDEALHQFHRQVQGMEADMLVINNSLTIARTDDMLAELTESRKLTEIHAEEPTHPTVALESSALHRLSARLAIVVAALGFIGLYGNIGAWLTAGLAEGRVLPASTSTWYKVLAFAHWPIMAGLLGGVFFLAYRHLNGRARADGDNTPLESHIFDYSFLSEEVTHHRAAEGAMRQLGKDMLDLAEPHRRKARPARSRSVFKEIPTHGVERVKHSLESQHQKDGAYYILHVEVERRFSDNTDGDASAAGGIEESEHLRDVRLVVRTPPGSLDEVYDSATWIVSDCVQTLCLTDADERLSREFFAGNFSWRSDQIAPPRDRPVRSRQSQGEPA